MLFNNRPFWGRDYLLIKAAGKTYRVGPNSFFQSNLAVAIRGTSWALLGFAFEAGRASEEPGKAAALASARVERKGSSRARMIELLARGLNRRRARFRVGAIALHPFLRTSP